MKKINKKGQFQIITGGLIAFITFVLIVATTIILISQTKSMSLVCPDSYYSGSCYKCTTAFPNFNGNTTATTCKNSSFHEVTAPVANSEVMNATLKLQTAAGLPADFAQIIMLVLLIVGILSVLAIVGFSAYNKMQR